MIIVTVTLLTVFIFIKKDKITIITTTTIESVTITTTTTTTITTTTATTITATTIATEGVVFLEKKSN